jgi:ribonuclease HI
MKGNMKKLQKVKRHLPLVHKRGNIRREIECMKMIVVVTHFWVPTKQNKMKNEKIQKIYQKILERNPKNNRSEKRMLEC